MFNLSGFNSSGPCGCCGSTPNCGSCCVTCSPCNIPKADLTCTVTPGPTVRLLKWNGASWSDGTFTLGCNISGNIALSGGGAWTLGATTCNPFSATFTQGGNTAVVTCNAYGTTTCCQTFTVNGCFSTIGTATVSVYDTSGGTLLAQGTMSNGGTVHLIWAGSCSVYVTASESSGRSGSYAQSLTLTSGGSTTISLPAGTDYVCLACCTPSTLIKKTLSLTDSQLGTCTLTWNGANAWAGSLDFAFGNCAGTCPAQTATVAYTLTDSTYPLTPCELLVKFFTQASGINCCPNTVDVTCNVPAAAFGPSISCFPLNITLTKTFGAACSGGTPYQMVYGATPVTWTITE